MTSIDSEPGRRERKKAATRRALSEAAMRLFLERGFDEVTVREIAEVADVSTTTLMNYFPTKEALVFDLDGEIERSLVAAVAERPPDISVPEALRRYLRERAERAVSGRHASRFMKLVLTTPALSDYWRKMWLRHEDALTRALAREFGQADRNLRCQALAHFALEAFTLATQSADAVPMIDVAFDILEHGWSPGEEPSD
ncbi:TetR family transcriptional regulator [Amycolatopsis mediterranei]|uniref:TetR family transcriptional regulator n=1 Tax=Amycolatopsis mediterranei TaxID=33910 RepID=UPI00343E3E21